MTITKELQKALLKEGIEVLDLPIGDYNNIIDPKEIKELLKELKEQKDQPFKTPLCVDYTGRDSIEVYEIETIEGTERVSEDVDNININNNIEGAENGSEEVSECIYFDISGKEGYKIPIPSSKDLLGNKNIDFRLLYILACNCSRYKEEEDSDYIWFISKDVLNNCVKPLYNRHRDTFNKKLKAIKETGILLEDKETGDLLYNYNKFKLFVRYDIEKILNLILSEGIKENSYRILTYLLIYCKKEKKTLSYDFIVKGIGLKNLNRNIIKDLLEPLKVNQIIKISQSIQSIGLNKFVTKNYYEVI